VAPPPAAAAATAAAGMQLRFDRTTTPSVRYGALLQLMQMNGFKDYENE